jgi:hypothetical protein
VARSPYHCEPAKGDQLLDSRPLALPGNTHLAAASQRPLVHWIHVCMGHLGRAPERRRSRDACGGRTRGRRRRGPVTSAGRLFLGAAEYQDAGGYDRPRNGYTRGTQRRGVEGVDLGRATHRLADRASTRRVWLQPALAHAHAAAANGSRSWPRRSDGSRRAIDRPSATRMNFRRLRLLHGGDRSCTADRATSRSPSLVSPARCPHRPVCTQPTERSASS